MIGPVLLGWWALVPRLCNGITPPVWTVVLGWWVLVGIGAGGQVRGAEANREGGQRSALPAQVAKEQVEGREAKPTHPILKTARFVSSLEEGRESKQSHPMLKEREAPEGGVCSAAAKGEQAERIPFALGVEYMVPGFAEVYAKTGLLWAKPMGVGFTWGEIEPQPPVHGKHAYRWDAVDRLILEYQQAGFRHFHIYLKAHCRWGSSKPLPLVGTPSFPPKPEHLNDYAEYVRQIVERYDKDGQDDAPGLLYPIEYWEIEAEWGTFWPGTPEEYLELLQVAHRAVKSANPRAKVILIGLFLAGVFEGSPDPPTALRTLAQRHPPIRVQQIEKGIADVKKLLAHPELFDVVEFHSLSDWSEIQGMSRFLRGLMRENGYEKPIWVGDVNYTASPLMFWGEPVPPYTPKQKPAIHTTLQALAQPRHPRHKEAVAWFRAEQSRGLVKKVVLAMAEGLAGINIGNMKDEALFGILPQITGTAAFHGLIDTEGMPAKPSAPRPAYHALSLLAQKLGAFSSVKPIELGQGVYAYRFTVRERPVYVLWYDDGRRYLPGDSEPTTTVRLPLLRGSYVLTEAPTASGPTPTRPVSPSGDGYLKLTLGPTPIFLEPSVR